MIFDHPAQFFTATNLNWIAVLQHNTCKQIIVDALKFRVKNGDVTIYAFVIMPNHIHTIWRIHNKIDKKDFQRDFLKFTAKHILNWSSVNEKTMYDRLQVNASDRKYQVWERNSLSIDLYNEIILLQKLRYIHNNPLQPRWKLADFPESYKYSSASFYHSGTDHYGFLSHYQGEGGSCSK